MKTLRKEARTREEKVVREILKSRDVVLATCVGAATYSLRDETFDLVVIDEGAQVRGCVTLTGEGTGVRTFLADRGRLAVRK